MARPAISRRADIPLTEEELEEVEKRTAAVQAGAALATLGKKTFEQLSAQEKDDLLKIVALRLGLILPSAE